MGTKWGQGKKKNERELYRKWHNMIRRCYDEDCEDYARYGAKGIEVYERWRSWPFFKEDMLFSYESHVLEFGLHETSIDRIDNFLGYMPDNVRWATNDENQRNRFQMKVVITKPGKVKIENRYYPELLRTGKKSV